MDAALLSWKETFPLGGKCIAGSRRSLRTTLVKIEEKTPPPTKKQKQFIMRSGKIMMSKKKKRCV